MDETLNKIDKLERELKEKEETLLLSARIGKDLLEDNGVLNARLEETINQNHTKCEKLEQDNYALSMRCQTKESTLDSLSAELEQLESSSKLKLEQVCKIHQEEITKLNDKVSSKTKLIEHLEDEKSTDSQTIDELQDEIKTLKERGHETMMHELSISVAEDSLQLQIVSLLNDKTELETELKNLQRSWTQSQKKNSFYEKSMGQIKHEMEHKECELTSVQNVVEKKNVEIEELKVEIENMNIEKIDPKKRGNSLFAELEDNRKMVEKRYLQLKDHYLLLQKQYKFKHDQNNRLKTQLAALLGQSANRGSLEYQEELQGMVSSLDSQLHKMVDNCQMLAEKNAKSLNCLCMQKDMEPDSMLDGYRQLYKHSQIENKKQSDKFSELMFAKVALSDQIIDLQRKYNMANKYKDSLRAEVINLRVKLDEHGVDLDAENINPVLSRRAEKLPSYDAIQRKKEEESRNKKGSVSGETPLVPSHESNSIPQEASSTAWKSNDEPIAEKNNKSNVDEQQEIASEIKIEEKENLDNIPKCQTKPSKGVKFCDSVVDTQKEKTNKSPLKDINPAVKSKRRLKKMDAPHIVIKGSQPSECTQQ